MAFLHLGHQWAFTFGLLGNIVSTLVYFAPVPTFIRIYKEKSTMGYDSLPYLVALFSAMLWMYYALLLKAHDAYLLISINSFGCLIEAIYIFLYLFYACKNAKIQTAKKLGIMNVGLFSAIFMFTLFKFQGSSRIQVVGWICVAVSVCVFAAPLSIVVNVVRTRSIEFMPFSLSFFLTLSAVMWFAYGVSRNDAYVAIPNVLGFSLGMLQMLLYAKFRNAKRQKIEEKKLPEQLINVMKVGTPEVHPVDAEKCGDKIEEIIRDEGEIDDCKSCVPCAASVEPSQVNLQPESHVVVVCDA